MLKRGKWIAPVILAGLLQGPIVQAEPFTTALEDQIRVNRVSATSILGGGCTAGLDKNLGTQVATLVPGCTAAVVFDCNGETGVVTKAQARDAFSNAQLALVTGKKVRLTVDNEKKINGNCLATRLDVFRY